MDAQKAFENIYGGSVGLEQPMWIDYPPLDMFKTEFQKALKSWSFKKALISDLFVQASQQLAGLNIVSHILESYDGEDLNTYADFFVTCILPIMGVIITFSMVDKEGIGRRWIILISLLCLAICLAILATIMGRGQFSESKENLFWVFCVIGVFKISYSMGLESLPVILNFELFAIDFMGLGAGLGTAANWAISLACNSIEGSEWTFSILIIHCFVIILLGIFISLLLEETRGKQLLKSTE